MKFDQLGLSEPILRAVAAEGYDVPTPIQIQAIPHVLAGKDILGCAQTGTGKTAAFALPMIQRLTAADHAAPASQPGAKPRRHILRALILSPTRELAVQIGDSFKAYGRNSSLRHTVIFGGVSQHHQVKALKAGVDIAVATPGRLLDLMNQGYVDLRNIEIFVLDEADRMLDMGFIHDIRKIVAKIPATRQTLFFSATMPSDIRALADKLLRNPVSVQVTPVASTVELIDQAVYFVPVKLKPQMLAHLIKSAGMTRTLVFTRTKHGADKVVKSLDKQGIASEAIHGNKSQNARQRALANLKTGRTAVLIATDIAARGIDIDDISHVVNYDLPNVPETYVHRIGRTARAGASGIAISLCDNAERPFLKDIERLTRRTIPVRKDQPQFAAPAASHGSDDSADFREDRSQRRRSGRGGNSNGNGNASQGRFFAPRQKSPNKALGGNRAGHGDAGGRNADGQHRGGAKPAAAAYPQPTRENAPAKAHASHAPRPHNPQPPRASHPMHAAQHANAKPSHGGKPRNGQQFRGRGKSGSPRPAAAR